MLQPRPILRHHLRHSVWPIAASPSRQLPLMDARLPYQERFPINYRRHSRILAIRREFELQHHQIVWAMQALSAHSRVDQEHRTLGREGTQSNDHRRRSACIQCYCPGDTNSESCPAHSQQEHTEIYVAEMRHFGSPESVALLLGQLQTAESTQAKSEENEVDTLVRQNVEHPIR